MDDLINHAKKLNIGLYFSQCRALKGHKQKGNIKLALAFEKDCVLARGQ